MTAEFVVALPAVVLVLACCLSGLSVAAEQLRVTDAAALAARTLARGGDPASTVEGLVPGAQVTRGEEGGLVCATLSVAASGLPLTLTARSCALGGGG